MKREELQHDFHNEQGINWLNSQGEPDIDYVMWLENKILAIKNNTPLPPAEGAELDHSHDHLLDHPEGAEEYLRKHPFLLGETEDGEDYLSTDDIELIKQLAPILEEFATLHAQRLAEKMVRERLRGAKDLIDNLWQTAKYPKK